MHQNKPLPSLVQRLLPGHPALADAEQRFSVEMVLFFGAFQALMYSSNAALELAWGTPALGALLLAVLPALLGVYLYLRRGGAVLPACHAMMAVQVGAIAAINFATGGRAIGANIALPTTVLVGVLMLRTRGALWWTAIALLQIALVAWLKRTGWQPPITPDPLWVQSAIDRVPFTLCVGAALVGLLARRALERYRARVQEARAQAEAARQRSDASEARFLDFAQIAADGFWETDADLRLTFASASFAEALGMQPEDMLGKTPEQAYRSRYAQAPDLGAYMQPLRERRAFEDQQLASIDRSGRHRLLSNQGQPVFDAAGEFRGFRGVVNDVTERERLTRQLREQAERDPLTGLLNRRSMDAALADAARDAASGQHGWLCYIDLDHFKQLNDRAGHAAGDELLQRFAGVLRECTRSQDRLARMGGDEFCLLLQGMDEAAARAVATRVLDRTAELGVEHGDAMLRVGASIGLACFTQGLDPDAALRTVDAACYSSKRQGRHRMTVAE